MIFEIILIPILFLSITGICFWLTENNKIPKWLQYPPWICYKCFSTWSLVGIGTMIIFLNLPLTGVTLIILGILNGMAMHWNEKNNTISVYDLE